MTNEQYVEMNEKIFLAAMKTVELHGIEAIKSTSMFSSNHRKPGYVMFPGSETDED